MEGNLELGFMMIFRKKIKFRFKIFQYYTTTNSIALLSLDGNNWIEFITSNKVNRHIFKGNPKEIEKVKYVMAISYIDPLTRVSWRPWLPGIWNSICFVSTNEYNKIYSNGVEVAATKGTFPTFSKENNFHLLGYEGKQVMPFFGSVTDVNIWNRRLEESDISQWSKFQSVLDDGRVYKWENNNFNYAGLTSEEINIKDIIKESYGKVLTEKIAFLSKEFKSFDDGVFFCDDLKGSVAVPNDNIEVSEWKETIEHHSKDCNERFFIGYKQSGEEFQFSSFYKNLNVSGFNWHKGEPNNWNNIEDCASYKSDIDALNDISCLKKMCPVCVIPKSVLFNLEGKT